MGRIRLDGGSFRIYTAPVINDGQAIAAVQVGRSEASTDTVLGYVQLAGALAMVVGLVLAWFSGIFSRARAGPVERIRRSAGAINAQGLSRRLGPPYSRDELGSLTRSLDAMTDRLERAFRREQQFYCRRLSSAAYASLDFTAEIEVSLRQERTSEKYQTYWRSSPMK